MKQNDKYLCDCGDYTQNRNNVCDTCQFLNDKSHSPNPVDTESKVRASEEDSGDKGLKTTSTTSSVPYTPLITAYKCDKLKGFFYEDDVVSALNGLKNDLEREHIMDLNGDTTYQHTSVLRLINKWFDIKVKEK